MRQPEYGRPVGDLRQRASHRRRASRARRAGPREWKQTLDAIEQQYGVDRRIILAIWGIETSFGANNGGFDVIRSLATLVAIGYRPDYFRDELLAALKILQDGHIARDKMIGSWAGAMGQPQFMPSNFHHARGRFYRRRPQGHLGHVPDVLASIANFLKHWGWKAGRAGATRSIVPKGFDYRAQPRELCGMGRARRQARGWQPLPAAATRSCSSRAARRARHSWSARISR